MASYSDRFVFLRVIKGGSAWVADVLLTQEGAKSFPSEPHATLATLRRDFPDLLEGRTTFGTVRNPWEWYPSWYRHRANDRGESITLYGFKSALWSATHSYNPTYRNPDAIGIEWELPKGAKPIGLCSVVHNITLSLLGDPVDYAIPVDRLSEGLIQLLGYEIQSQFTQHRNTRGERDQGGMKGVEAKDLYDEEMISWVSVADAEFIRLFDFHPFQRSTSSIYCFKPDPHIPSGFDIDDAEPAGAEE